MSDHPDDKETRIQAAIAAVRAGDVPSLRQAAKLFDVPRGKLTDRFNGMKDRRTAQQPHQRLSPEEEESIVKAAMAQLDSWGRPMSIGAIENLAAQLLLAKGDTKPLGKCWCSNFLARHPELRTFRARALEQSKKNALDQQARQTRGGPRRAVLRGKVEFVKLVWEEMPVEFGVFD
ncbi:hypothetical protein VTH82DRAFT_683 [Thermothelomyces myriococcoides]